MNIKNFQKVSDLFDEIIPERLKKKSFIYNNIFNNWKQIVGEDISIITNPCKLKFSKNKSSEAILTIEVHEMLVHQVQLLIEQIIQRINFFYGLNAVKEIKLKKTNNLNLLKSD